MILPAYMTATWSAKSVTTPRSWVIMLADIPLDFCSSTKRSSIGACIVTSGAMAGSSAISLRIAGYGYGDHDALAQAAGMLVRIGGNPAFGDQHANTARLFDCTPAGFGPGHTELPAVGLIEVALTHREKILAIQADRAV